jgi:hypothetical protein
MGDAGRVLNRNSVYMTKYAGFEKTEGTIFVVDLNVETCRKQK